MSRPPDSSTNRFLKLAGMTARIGGDVARERWKRLWHTEAERSEADAALYTRIGREIASTLGDMKGAVMKVGQVVSQYRDILPAELVEALGQLQKDSPPRPYAEIEPRLREAFNDRIAELFEYIDPVAMASASIAQVHRARTRDGREVVIKVQYPGVDTAVASDLSQLKLALKIARVLPVPGEVLDALFTEISRSLHEELDYRHEAAAIEAFRAFHASDPQVVIPAVLPELSGQRVLTLTYEPGDPLAELGEDYSAETRDAIGQVLFKTLAGQIYRFRRVHCDPHPGNFAARPDGSLVIYDFGCIKELSQDMVDTYSQLTRAALAGNAGGLENSLIRLGARNTRQTVALPHDFYKPWMQLAQDSLGDDIVDYGSTPLAERAIRLSRKALPQWRAFQPVPGLVLINRALGGHYWNLRQLGCRLALRPLLMQALPDSGRA